MESIIAYRVWLKSIGRVLGICGIALVMILLIIAISPRQEDRSVERQRITPPVVEKKLIMVLPVIVRLILVGKVVVGLVAGAKEVERILLVEIKGAHIVLVMLFQRRLVALPFRQRNAVAGLVGLLISLQDVEPE